MQKKKKIPSKNHISIANSHFCNIFVLCYLILKYNFFRASKILIFINKKKKKNIDNDYIR